MKYGSIAGEMKGKYKGWIELHSCQFGVARNATESTGRSVGREASVPNVSEVVVTKSLDNTSSRLFQESLTGTGAKVEIDFVMNDALQTVYLHVELADAMVSNYQLSSGGDRPTESLGLNFTKITYQSTVATNPPATKQP